MGVDVTCEECEFTDRCEYFGLSPLSFEAGEAECMPAKMGDGFAVVMIPVGFDSNLKTEVDTLRINFKVFRDA